MGWLQDIKQKIGFTSSPSDNPNITLQRKSASDHLRNILGKQNLPLSDYTATYALLLGITQLWKQEAFEAAWDNPDELQHVIIRTINFYWKDAEEDSCLTKSYEQSDGELEQMRKSINWQLISEFWESTKKELLPSNP